MLAGRGGFVLKSQEYIYSPKCHFRFGQSNRDILVRFSDVFQRIRVISQKDKRDTYRGFLIRKRNVFGVTKSIHTLKAAAERFNIVAEIQHFCNQLVSYAGQE